MDRADDSGTAPEPDDGLEFVGMWADIADELHEIVVVIYAERARDPGRPVNLDD